MSLKDPLVFCTIFPLVLRPSTHIYQPRIRVSVCKYNSRKFIEIEEVQQVYDPQQTLQSPVGSRNYVQIKAYPFLL